MKSFLPRWCSLIGILLVLILTSVHSIYQEQAGEYDWRSENVGAVRQSLVYRDEAFVGSEHGVVACLRVNNGSVKWRVVLPFDTEVVKMALVKNSLVTVTRQCRSASSADSASCVHLVRAWAVLDGALQWDVSLGRFSAGLEATSADPVRLLSESLTDLEYDAKNNVLSVLSHNSVHFVTPPAFSDGAPSVWSWTPEESDVVVSHLVVATHVDGGGGASGGSSAGKRLRVRAAAGCRVAAGTAPAQCSELFVAKVAHSEATVTLDWFPAFSAAAAPVHPASIRALVSSEEPVEQQYHMQDLLFANSFALSGDEGEESTQPVVLLLQSLAGGPSAALSTPATHRHPTDVHSFVYAAVDGALHPAVSFCTEDEQRARSCHAFSAMEGSGTNSVQWRLRSLFDDAHGRAACSSAPSTILQVANSAGLGVTVALQRNPQHLGVAADVHCLTADWQQQRSGVVTLDAVSVLSASQPLQLTTFRVDHSTAGAVGGGGSGVGLAALLPQIVGTSQASLSGEIATQSFARGGMLSHWAAVVRRASSSASASLHLLLTDRTGTTTALRHGFPSSGDAAQHSVVDNAAAALWARSEHLSRLQQAALRNAVSSATQEEVAESSSGSGVEDVTAMLTPAARWRHQKSQLWSYGADFLDLFRGGSSRGGSERAVQQLLLDRVRSGSSGRSESKMELFGFGKVVVGLSYSPRLARYLDTDVPASASSAGPVSFVDAGFVLSGYSLMSSVAADGSGGDFFEPLWHAVLVPPAEATSSSSSSAVVLVKLLSLSPSSLHPVATVLVAMDSGDSFVWHVDVHKGLEVVRSGSAVCASGHRGASVSAVGGSSAGLLPANRGPVRSVVLVEDPEHAHAHMAVLVHAPLDKSVAASHTLGTLVRQPQLHSGDDFAAPSNFVHSVDVPAGRLAVYRAARCDNKVAAQWHSELFPCLVLDEVAAVAFSPDSDSVSSNSQSTIVAVAQRAAGDVVHTRTSILGDDSVLLKYLNPNVVMVATLQEQAPTPSGAENNNSSSSSVEPAHLVAYLVDTVSGRVIKKVSHGPAARPVRACLVENVMAVSYWNPKAMRAELSVTALLEGAIDKKGMGPLMGLGLSSRPLPLPEAPPSGTKRHVLSSFSSSAAVPPLAMQKSYVLPRLPLAMEHSISAAGVANKNLLLQFANGQIYSVDMRQVHPRRPLEEPTMAEKQEGLQRYNPFLSMVPFNAITVDYSLALGAAAPRPRLLSAPSRLESSSVLLSFGGLDVHVGRVMPSGGFDLLASDFNHALLMTVLGGLSMGVFMLRRAHKNKQLAILWR